MVLPTLIIYAVFIIVPVFVAIYYSFTDYSGLGKAGFVGIQNYTRMFHDTLFLIALRNTVVVLICSVVFLLAGSFLTALLMNVSFRGNAFFKMVVFAPYVIAPIIIGIIWGYLLNPNYGLVNSVLRNLGLDALAIEWIGGTKWSPPKRVVKDFLIKLDVYKRQVCSWVRSVTKLPFPCCRTI